MRWAQVQTRVAKIFKQIFKQGVAFFGVAELVFVVKINAAENAL